MSRGIEDYVHYLLVFVVAFLGSMAARTLEMPPDWAFAAGAITMVLLYGFDRMLIDWLQGDYPEVDDE